MDLHLDGELVARKEPFASHFVLDGKKRAARTLGFSMAKGGLSSGRHSHREAQLVYVVRGEVTCEADGAWWIVPPSSALWVPGGTEHLIRARAPLEGYNVYLAPKVAHRLPTSCCAVSVTPLFREVVLRLATYPSVYDPKGPDGRLVAVLLDELSNLAVENHRLPMPSDARLRRLVTMMTASPADGADMKTWARRVGVAERTLTRLLVRETGLSFGRWRQQLHIVLAIGSLSRGASVKTVASELGYDNASSFVTMFRKALGTSPARYIAERTR